MIPRIEIRSFLFFFVASMSLKIANQLPRDVLIPVQSTTGGAILNSSLVEILPTDVSDYSPNSNTIIEFNVSLDELQFMRSSKSYFKFTVTLTKAANTDTTPRSDIMFDEAGIHSLFRSVHILSPAGAEISKMDHYHRAITPLMAMTSDPYSDYQTKWIGGDAVFGSAVHRDDTWYDIGLPGQVSATRGKLVESEAWHLEAPDSNTVYFHNETWPGNRDNWANAGILVLKQRGAATFPVGPVFRDLAPGYELLLLPQLGADFSIPYVNFRGTVLDISPDQTQLLVKLEPHRNVLGAQRQITGTPETQTVGPAAGSEAALTPAYGYEGYASGYNIEGLKYRKRRKNYWNGIDILKQAPITFTFQLENSFLKHTLPLGLTSGIRIRLELERSERALTFGPRDKLLSFLNTPIYANANAVNATLGTYTGSGLYNTGTYEYSISTPRFFVNVITMNPSIQKEYVSYFNSPDGLVYYCPSIRTFRYQGTAGSSTQDIQLMVALRSLRKCIVVLTDSVLADGVSDKTRRANSLSTWLRAGLVRYQARIGAVSYPVRWVDVYDSPNEVFQQALGGLDTNSTRIDQTEFVANRASRWRESWNFNDAFYPDSTKFMFVIDLTKDDGPGSALTGADGGKAPFELNLEYSRAYSSYQDGNPVYYIMFLYDNFVTLKGGANNGFAVSN